MSHTSTTRFFIKLSADKIQEESMDKLKECLREKVETDSDDVWLDHLVDSFKPLMKDLKAVTNVGNQNKQGLLNAVYAHFNGVENVVSDQVEGVSKGVLTSHSEVLSILDEVDTEKGQMEESRSDGVNIETLPTGHVIDSDSTADESEEAEPEKPGHSAQNAGDDNTSDSDSGTEDEDTGANRSLPMPRSNIICNLQAPKEDEKISSKAFKRTEWLSSGDIDDVMECIKKQCPGSIVSHLVCGAIINGQEANIDSFAPKFKNLLRKKISAKSGISAVFINTELGKPNKDDIEEQKGNHWVLLVWDHAGTVENPRSIEYFDSLGEKLSDRPHVKVAADNIVAAIRGILGNIISIDIKEVLANRIQKDGSSCGLHVLNYVRHRVSNNNNEYYNSDDAEVGKLRGIYFKAKPEQNKTTETIPEGGTRHNPIPLDGDNTSIDKSSDEISEGREYESREGSEYEISGESDESEESDESGLGDYLTFDPVGDENQTDRTFFSYGEPGLFGDEDH